MKLLLTATEKLCIDFKLADLVAPQNNKKRAKESCDFFDDYFFEVCEQVAHHTNKLIQHLFRFFSNNYFQEEMCECLWKLLYIFFAHFCDFLFEF